MEALPGWEAPHGAEEEEGKGPRGQLPPFSPSLSSGGAPKGHGAGHCRASVELGARRPSSPAQKLCDFDRSFALSLLICKTETETPAQSISRKGDEAQNNGCALQTTKCQVK